MYYITYHLFYLTILALLGILEYLNYSSVLYASYLISGLGVDLKIMHKLMLTVVIVHCYPVTQIRICPSESPSETTILRCGGKKFKYLEQSIHNQKCVFSLGNRRTWFPPGRRS